MAGGGHLVDGFVVAEVAIDHIHEFATAATRAATVDADHNVAGAGEVVFGTD